MDKPKTDINLLFSSTKDENSFLKVCAPMVRYSKLQFRSLVRKYGTDLCFSPMILADSFCQSSKARYNEFSTSQADTPLIVQFAAKTEYDFVGAAELVYSYADGVDLNCGCPQRWAMKDGYGCSMLNTPETIYSLVRSLKNRLPESFSVSVKIRLLKELKRTVELCRGLERCGVNFVTVHGRRPWQKNSDSVDYEALKEIKESIRIPMVANGNVKTLQDAENMHSYIQCDGVMSAQGILTNPALFSGATVTPLSCLQDWLRIKQNQPNMSFQCFHHHLVFMLEKTLTKKQKRIFNYLTSFEQVYTYLNETFNVDVCDVDNTTIIEEVPCSYNQLDYSTLKEFYGGEIDNGVSVGASINNYITHLTDGKYFKSKLVDNCDLDNMDSSLFDELL